MNSVTVDFEQKNGKVKPMHAVNNGPVYKFYPDQRITNLGAYRDAGIPYARTHDASFYANYGGEHTVDIHALFPDFDGDPYDSASYDFCLTDEYLKVIDMGGAKTFYRLGSKIEHWPKKYGTLPPKDFKKWAVICEQIIRHYTEGWADGFHFGIEYWEIWNEPDLDADDSRHKRCWGGTKKEFFEFYDVAARHLKCCFPHLKIGGPAIAGDTDWMKEFLVRLSAPLDFFSWHRYADDPQKVIQSVCKIKGILDECGYSHVESILNEWNFVKGFDGDDWIYSLKSEKSMKGAAFSAAVMCACQNAPVDMLMYYDARPCVMNGLFSTDFVNECLKGYYPFKMFNTLYRLGEAAVVTSDHRDIYAAAASNGEEAAVMLAHFSMDENAAARPVAVELSGFFAKDGVTAQVFLLDEANDMAPIREEIFRTEAFAPILTLANESCCLIKLKKLQATADSIGACAAE